jgi:hypothetical protein
MRLAGLSRQSDSLRLFPIHLRNSILNHPDVVEQDSPFDVDSKPFSPSEGVMFTIAVITLALSSFADLGTPLFEVQSTVINRGNYNLPSAVRETVLPVSDNPNKPVVE